MDNWTIHNILPDALPAPMEPDRGGYTLTMRESSGAGEVLARLVADATDGGRVHVGWGSFRNLDIAAVRRSSWVLLLDINRHQFRVWEGVAAAMDDPRCIDAESFVKVVVPLLPHQPRLRQFSPSTESWLTGDRKRPGSWLFDDRPDRFRWIRDLFRQGKVAMGCVDLRASPDSGVFAEMAKRMGSASADCDVEFDTLYVSNLPWMLAQREGFFGESNAQFAHDGAESVLEQVRDNLLPIATRFRHVISAGCLASTSQKGDLQWQTQLLTPAEFVDQRYWSVLAPVSGPFRSLR